MNLIALKYISYFYKITLLFILWSSKYYYFICILMISYLCTLEFLINNFKDIIINFLENPLPLRSYSVPFYCTYFQTPRLVNFGDIVLNPRPYAYLEPLVY